MYTPHDPFLRNSDGLIDFDRYRSEAYALRRQALQDTSKLRAVFKLIVVIALLLGAVAVAPPKQEDAGDNIVASRSSSRTASHAAPVSPPLF
jgi:hypothetical protein